MNVCKNVQRHIVQIRSLTASGGFPLQKSPSSSYVHAILARGSCRARRATVDSIYWAAMQQQQQQPTAVVFLLLLLLRFLLLRPPSAAAKPVAQGRGGMDLAAAVVTVGTCGASSHCLEPLVCVDNTCMCSPATAHTGPGCDSLSSTSWMLVVVLVLVTVTSIQVLASAARRNSVSPADGNSGVRELYTIAVRNKPGAGK